ncbi:hypothetical protein [Lyngbya aestuarii]|uniref:hypothetical protein n=1 Tax=Lyngbya aestuarii TaxID=118322 RepID=UPI00403D7E51
MKIIKHYYLLSLTIGTMFVGLGSYSFVAANSRVPSATLTLASDSQATASLVSNDFALASEPHAVVEQDSTATKTLAVNIYTTDSQCQALVPEVVTVPASNSVSAAVDKVLAQTNSADFELVGYRVNIDADTKIATIDLRRSPDAQRQFVSLSTCEQYNLFGSLRKTLTTNSPLNIKDVRFMEQGQEIYL